jgi:hypothetical protein
LALEADLELVRAVRLDRPSRDGALRCIWSRSAAAVLGYLDVDLSTGLNALLPLLAPLLPGHSDVAIGTRLATGAQVIRGPRREIISRCCNLVLRGRDHRLGGGALPAGHGGRRDRLRTHRSPLANGVQRNDVHRLNASLRDGEWRPERATGPRPKIADCLDC